MRMSGYHSRGFIFSFLILSLIGLPYYFGGVGGCGSSTSSSDSGVSANSASSLPSLELSDYYNTSSTSASTSALQALGIGNPGDYCTDFCHMQKCFSEFLRHTQEAELFVEVLKAVVATDANADFPASGERFLTVTLPPSFEGGETVSVRLTTAGTVRKAHIRDAQGQIIEGTITQDGDNVSVVLVQNFRHGDGAAELSRIDVSANCTAAELLAGTAGCQFVADGQMNGVFGQGHIRATFNADGTNSLDYAFDTEPPDTADIPCPPNDPNCGAREFEGGDETIQGVGVWVGNGNGCFLNKVTGNRPPELPENVALGEDAKAAGATTLNGISGCELNLNQPVCANPNADNGNVDFAACPFINSATACDSGFNDNLVIQGGERIEDFASNVYCCAITGTTIGSQEGTYIANSAAGTVLTAVNSRTLFTTDVSIAYTETWDGTTSGDVIAVDLNGAPAANLTEMSRIKTALEEVDRAGGDSCDDTRAERQSIEAGRSQCQTDANCTGTKVCLTDNNGFGRCGPPRVTCTTSADCPNGEPCMNSPRAGGFICALPFNENGPGFANLSCSATQPCPPGMQCDGTTCQPVTNTTCATNADCHVFGPGAECNGGSCGAPGCTSNADCSAKGLYPNCESGQCKPPAQGAAPAPQAPPPAP